MPPSDPTSPNLPDLTHKQREVLALVADNRTSKEIAARLDISESAVNQRIESVRARLGGIPRGELARLFRHEQENHSAELPAESPGNALAWQDAPPARSMSASADEAGRNGAQLSVNLPGSQPRPKEPGLAGHQGGGVSLVHASFFLAMLVIAMAIAAAVTALIGPTIAGN